MLNRRHLRIKILHALYSYYSSDERDLPKAERQLLFSLDKFYELYILLFSTIIALRNYSEERIDLAKKRLVPSPEDLDPNTRFIDNRYLRQLFNDDNLTEDLKKYKTSWKEEDTRKVLKSILQEMKDDDVYVQYMAQDNVSFDDDKVFVISLFKRIICNNEMWQTVFLEQSVFWADDLDLACSMVIKSLKKLDQDMPMEPLPLFKDKDEQVFVRDLFRQAIIQNEENSKLIKDKLENWDEDRLAKMDIILMKMALAEVKTFKFIPSKVSMNEYIEIAKFYSTPQSNKFINGILDKLFLELKADGTIKKSGRGLLEN